MKGTNKVIEDHGTWLEVDVSTPKYPTATMKIDKDDLVYIQSMAGRISACQRTTLIYANARGNDGKTILIHREIFGDTGKKVIDHINHDGLDNRRENLRVCTQSENLRNRLASQTNSKSGILGVSWSSNSKKWHAQIKAEGCKAYLGTYENIDDAITARREAEIKYFGEYAGRVDK